jgi:cytochrome d ubiquinol oxidase subunit II
MYVHIEPSLAILVVWVFVFIYSMAGSVDLGASFWAMVYAERKPQAGLIANRFLSPTWEITNTILVFLVVAMVGFFPGAAFRLGGLLLVPLSIILLLLTLRSAFMVFSYAVEESQKWLRFVSGLTGLFVPVLLIGALPVTEGGFTAGDRLVYDRWLTNPSVYLYMLFGLASELFLSALFLADYARESGDEEAVRIYRQHALWTGPVAVLAAMFALRLLEPSAHWLLAHLWDQREWFVVSIIFFLIGYAALWWPGPAGTRGRPRLAMLMVILQYGVATFGYGLAHLPYMVYPDLTVDKAFTNIETFYTLLRVFTFGLAILLPGFVIFWRLFMKDKRYLRSK